MRVTRAPGATDSANASQPGCLGDMALTAGGDARTTCRARASTRCSSVRRVADRVRPIGGRVRRRADADGARGAQMALGKPRGTSRPRDRTGPGVRAPERRPYLLVDAGRRTCRVV